MLSDYLTIGDNVVFNIDPDRRYWTNEYDDIPDGTIGVVCGINDTVVYQERAPVYSSRRPGIYHCKGGVSVLLPNGRIVMGDGCADLIDTKEKDRRIAALRDERCIPEAHHTYLGDLPETKFWEQDRVRVVYPQDGTALEGIVSRIDYYHMHQRCSNGSAYPFYAFEREEGGQSYAAEAWMELIERGNVWKYYNARATKFADLDEEASFYRMLGKAEEVPNPASGLYVWTIDEALKAVKAGDAHGFSVENGFFGSGAHISVVRFLDESLGRRVADATLEGFDLAG